MTDHLQPRAGPNDDEGLLHIAMAIADGTPVDWSADGSGQDPPAASAMQGRLRALERLVRGHDEHRSHTYAGERATTEETILTEARRIDPAVLDVHWGPLIVREKLGHGSFGDVYRALDPRLQRDVALKLLAATDDGDPTIAEARRLAAVSHANVVPVFGADRIDGRTGIWMQLVRGRTLYDEVLERGPLPAAEVTQIGIELAAALQAVHDAGLLHRDVKAQNILRDSNGRVMLGDFGTSVEHAAGEDGSQSAIAGTPLYLAPEVLHGGPATVASDLYALGVVLYFAATGAYPVSGASTAEIRDAHERGRRIAITALRPGLPGTLATTVEALLQPVPSDRPESAAGVAAALVPSETAGSRSALPMIALTVLAAAVVAMLAWVWRGAPAPGSIGTRPIQDVECQARPRMSEAGWIPCVRWSGNESTVTLLDPVTNTRRELPNAIAGRITAAVLSPDGNRIVYSIQRGSSATRPDEIRTYDLDTENDARLAFLPEAVAVAELRAWVPHANAVVVYVYEKGEYRLDRLDVDTGTWETLFRLPATAQGHDISPDGQLVAFDTPDATGQRDIRVCRLADGACETVAAHPAEDVFPFWAPDGSLLFNSDRGGTNGVWKAVFDTGRMAAPDLIQDIGRASLRPLGFDRDGRLAYELRDRRDIFQTPADGRGSPLVRVSLEGLSTNTAPAWSQDGRLAWVTLEHPSSDFTLIIQNADGSMREWPLELTRLNSSRLAWSPDGKSIAVYGLQKEPNAGSRKPGIQIIDVETGGTSGTFTPLNSNGGLGWLDNHTVAYSLGAGIGAYDFATLDDRVVWVNRNQGTDRVIDLRVSPARDQLAVTVHAREGLRSSVLMIPSTGGEATVLGTDGESRLYAHDWLPGGRELLVTRLERGMDASRLFALPIDGTSPERPLGEPIERLDWVRVAPNGRLAIAVGPRPPTFWLSDQFR